jgi:hypothetical protein
MKQIKFITTFSKNGYHVYGKNWINSFMEKTNIFSNITANVYIDSFYENILKNNEKIKFFEYEKEIPLRNEWEKIYRKESIHNNHNKELAVKFSYKSFVILHELVHTDVDYLIWLDADCEFLSDDFLNWPKNLIGENFVACQKEDTVEHIETGIVIFNINHNDKKVFVEKLKSFYMESKQFNNFGQFFDGYVIGRTLNTIKINFLNLNEKYGIGGIQSDPNCTFLNPEIKKRFIHNIGITGKKKYDEWSLYSDDKFFSLIPGANNITPQEKKTRRLKKLKELKDRKIINNNEVI